MGRLFNRAALTGRRKELRKNMPEPEHRLWAHLKGRQIKGYKFRRQESIGRYIVDFYCPECRLAIEIDGESHYQKEQILRDKKRQQYLEAIGIVVLRYTNRDILESIEGVVEEIRKHVSEHKEKSPSPNPSLTGGA